MAREMKDSGIEWIGEIPREWEVAQLKRFINVNNGREIETEVQDTNGAIPVYGSGGVFKYTNIPLFDGETVMFGRKGTLGKPIYANEKLWTVDTMYFLTFSDDIFAKFNYYQLVSFDWNPHITQTALPSVVGSEIVSCHFAFPPFSEQQSIAVFLDTQCAHIDSVIEKTRAAIEEYKKLKQAVITKAVTKGIRPNREMKDSGIEWFPVIPMEWTVSRVGLHYDIILGKMLCQNQLNNDYTLEPYYCAANVHFDGVSNTDLKQMWFSTAEKEQYLVKEGDLLVVEGGAGAGGSAIVVSVDKPTYVQNSVMIVRPKNTSNNCYLRYLLEFLVKEGYIEVACNKATIPHFTKDKLANVPYLVSNEQSEIVAYLDEKTAAIDSLVQKKEQLITELEAYKKSLIYEYVTGKKEVV